MNVELQKYHDDTLLVESLISGHKYFDPINDSSFSKEESEAFHRVYLPDWNRYKNSYELAFQFFSQKEPEVFKTAQQVLKVWLENHGVKG